MTSPAGRAPGFLVPYLAPAYDAPWRCPRRDSGINLWQRVRVCGYSLLVSHSSSIPVTFRRLRGLAAGRTGGTGGTGNDTEASEILRYRKCETGTETISRREFAVFGNSVRVQRECATPVRRFACRTDRFFKCNAPRITPDLARAACVTPCVPGGMGSSRILRANG